LSVRVPGRGRQRVKQLYSLRSVTSVVMLYSSQQLNSFTVDHVRQSCVTITLPCSHTTHSRDYLFIGYH